MENKRENFKRVAEKRMEKIINMISLLGNLSNSSFYEYSDEEIETLFGEIQSELDKQHRKLTRKNAEKKRVEF